MRPHLASGRISTGRFFMTLLTLCLVLSFWSLVLAQKPSPVGLWKTVSDKTGEATSYVRITLENDALVGKIEKLIRKPGQNPNPLCKECTDEKKDQPIQGLTILSNLTQDGDEWNGGYILDPDNGTYYKCYVRVVEDNQKLEVRGYIGFSLFGRTQVWIREE